MTDAPPAFNPNSIAGAEAPTRLEKPLQDCPVKHVTGKWRLSLRCSDRLYNDRAEVTRRILLEKGELSTGAYDIVVSDVSSRCDGDSLRVKGQGSFEILEVALQVVYGNKDEPERKRKEHQLEDELKALQKEKDVLEARRTRSTQLRSYMQDYVRNMVARTQHNGHPGLSVGVDTMNQVMEFYTTQSASLNATINQDDAEVEDLNERLEKVRHQLNTVRAAAGPTVRRDITISVNVLSDEDELALELSYVVSGASWQPAYDMRLACAEQTMTLIYYGLVTQNTGEDWNGCQISLSTATPAISGHPPALPSKVVVARRPVYEREKKKRGGMPSMRRREKADYEERFMMKELADDLEAEEESDEFAPVLDEATTFQAAVKNSDATGSSLFEIRREVFIQSDNKSHKVVITTLEFPATLAYYAAPAASPHAYLQAKARNDSDYPLLASSNMGVYVDGSFITKTELKTVNPREVFSAYLGVDPTIKVEYRPVQRTERTTGWVTRTKTVTYDYCTIITNTKPSAALVFVVDSLPKSTLDKITVELRAPATERLRPIEDVLGLDESKSEQPSFTDTQIIDQLIGQELRNPFVLLNPTSNNLIWVNPVAPSQKATLPFSYGISHPTDFFIQIH